MFETTGSLPTEPPGQTEQPRKKGLLRRGDQPHGQLWLSGDGVYGRWAKWWNTHGSLFGLSKKKKAAKGRFGLNSKRVHQAPLSTCPAHLILCLNESISALIAMQLLCLSVWVSWLDQWMFGEGCCSGDELVSLPSQVQLCWGVITRAELRILAVLSIHLHYCVITKRFPFRTWNKAGW